MGGSVRDSLLGKAPTDYDFAVSSLPGLTKEILRQFCLACEGASVYTVGEEYGTIGMAFSDGQKLEFTTFRGEVYPTDSRKPKVVFGTTLLDDLARRDFTINAMARDPLSGSIIDPFGGQDHLAQKIIACVGSDAERFDEDPLRMLRAIRFGCLLQFNIKVTMPRPDRLAIISPERIREELCKILLSDQPDRGLKLLLSFGLMKYVLPELLQLRGLNQGQNHVEDALEHTISVLRQAAAYDLGEDNLILRLGTLLHDIGKSESVSHDESGIHFYNHEEIGEGKSLQILRRLKFEEGIISRVANLVRRHMEPVAMSTPGGLNARTVSRLMRRMATPNHYDIQLLVALASSDIAVSAFPKPGFIESLRKLVAECEQKLPRQASPVSGEEIMQALNIPPSRLVGEIKEYLVDYVIEHGQCSPEVLLKEAKKKFGL